MATTTNYGWTTPDDTALVKDGAAAIRSLGSAIDTSMNTALGTKKAGLVLLNTTSFSAVSSQSLNNIFSSAYDNYRIIVTASSTADNNFYIRMRVGGVDNTTASSYIIQRLSGSSTTVSGVRSTSDTFDSINIFNSDAWAMDMTMYRPFLTKPTLLTAHTNYATSSASIQLFSGQHNQSTSYDGITFYIGSGNITGTVRIYGFN